jgi:hypothetical protein
MRNKDRSADGRAKARRKLVIRALLLCGEGAPALACTLLDISETGARLTTDDTSKLPDAFTIVFTPQGTPRRRCRLVWRGAADFGVSFELKESAPHRMLQPGVSRDDAISAFALRS